MASVGEKQLLKVFKEMQFILYSLGALFITKGTFGEVQVYCRKSAAFFGRQIQEGGKHDKVL